MAALVGLLALSGMAEARRGKKNCGLKCFSWKKCMGQLNGNNRPGQLGDTGQIVLNKCDSGGCDCAALEEEEKNKKAASAAAKAPPTTTARPSATAFTRTRGSSLASLISRRKPIALRGRTPETSQKSPLTLQSLQSSSKRFSRPRVVSTSQRATYSVSSSTSASAGDDENPPQKRDLIKDQIASGGNSKSSSRFASYTSRNPSSKKTFDTPRRRLRYFSRRRL